MGFFDNLSKKATETYKNTTDKTNRMAREMKLKSYIGENKNKIERIYTEIGRKVYEKHNEGKIGEIEEYIKPELDEIAEVTRKIENMNSEIRAINNLKLCDKCFAEIGLDSKFCPKCGAKQEEKEEPKQEPQNAVEAVIVADPVLPVEVATPAEEAVAEPVTENVVEAPVADVPEEPVPTEEAPANEEPANQEENN
jgi:ribosomal protein L40E